MGSRPERRCSSPLQAKRETRRNHRRRLGRGLRNCFRVDGLDGSCRRDLLRKELADGTAVFRRTGDVVLALAYEDAALCGGTRPSSVTIMTADVWTVVMEEVRRSYREQVTGEQQPRCDTATHGDHSSLDKVVSGRAVDSRGDGRTSQRRAGPRRRTRAGDPKCFTCNGSARGSSVGVSLTRRHPRYPMPARRIPRSSVGRISPIRRRIATAHHRGGSSAT